MKNIDAAAAAYMVKVAAALNDLNDTGDWYVAKAQIGFKGDDVPYFIVPNEHGEYDLATDSDY